MEKTTIQINISTLERLKALKRYERESYDELLNNLIAQAQDDTLSDEEIEDLKEALEEVKQGKTKSIEEVATQIGVSLS